jgi:DNA polymerase-3 subunit gamma/tau
LYYQIALLGKRDLELAPTPAIGFEMTMLRLLAFKLNQPSMMQPIPSPTPLTDSQKPLAIVDPIVEANNIINEWRDLLPKLELSGLAYVLAANCKVNNITDNHISLALSTHHQPMLSDKLKERIEESLIRYFNRPMKLEIQLSDEDLMTPIKQKEQAEKKEIADLKQKILQNPQVKNLIEMYDATLDINLPA